MKLLLSALMLLASASVAAECTRPAAPELPDGAVASLEEMVAGQKTVKAYVADTEAYLDCLNAEETNASEEEAPEEKMARIEEHNSAVDEMEAVATTFNEEIAEYKEKAAAQ